MHGILGTQPAPRATPRTRSYQVRRQIADLIGAPAGSDFTTYLPVRLADPAGGPTIECILTATDNAGFRGVEGSYETGPGSRIHGRSLGYIVAIRDGDSWKDLD